MHYNIYIELKNTQKLFVDTYVYSETIFLKEENDKYKIRKSAYLCKRGKRLTFHRNTRDFNMIGPILSAGWCLQVCQFYDSICLTNKYIYLMYKISYNKIF